MKKKRKSLKNTWSDEDSDDNQEDDDDHVNNYVGFQVTFEKDTSSTVANSVATATATSFKSDDVTTCYGSVSKFSEDCELDDNVDSVKVLAIFKLNVLIF